MINTSTFEVQQVQASRLASTDFDQLPFGKVFSDHMFVADYHDGQWHEPRIVPFKNLELSPATLVLHYGQAIFEGMKAFRNADTNQVHVFRPEKNMERFNKSAVRLCMPEVPESYFMEGIRQWLELDREWVPTKDGFSFYIRPFMFASDDYIGVKPSTRYKFIIFGSPSSPYYADPVRVKIEKHFSRAVKGGTGFAKAAGNYAAALYPAKLAQDQGYHQLIWTDALEHKYIEESGTMNVFFVISGKLLTPPVSDTILNGVTRDSVLAIAREWGMEVEERKITVDEVAQALENGTMEEAFGAGTAATIAHIRTIANDDRDYDLPPIAQRKFSNKILQYMDDLKRGRVENFNSWNMVI